MVQLFLWLSLILVFFIYIMMVCLVLILSQLSYLFDTTGIYDDVEAKKRYNLCGNSGCKYHLHQLYPHDLTIKPIKLLYLHSCILLGKYCINHGSSLNYACFRCHRITFLILRWYILYFKIYFSGYLLVFNLSYLYVSLVFHTDWLSSNCWLSM